MDILYLVDFWILCSIIPYILVCNISGLIETYYINYEASGPILIAHTLSTQEDSVELWSFLAIILISGPIIGGLMLLIFLYDFITNMIRLQMIRSQDRKRRLEEAPFWRLKKYGGYLK